jgi:6-phosphogluconolactonase
MTVPGIRNFEQNPELIMETFFETREEASIAAASEIEAALARRLEQQSEASLVVSGGTSPVLCFAELAARPVAWQRVHVLLSDERCVPPSDDDSNEKLIRETLLQGNAAEASFHPFYDGTAAVEQPCDAMEEIIRTLPFPFACSLIGMGEDGHFASLFPDAENLTQGLDADGSQLCLPVNTPASPHPRITLTLAALSRSDVVVLLFFGAAKRDVYERAKAESNGYPVSRLLLQKRAPVHVFWAP